jgi:hypothetical protein
MKNHLPILCTPGCDFFITKDSYFLFCTSLMNEPLTNFTLNSSTTLFHISIEVQFFEIGLWLVAERENNMLLTQFSDNTTLTSAQMLGTKWSPEKVVKVIFTQTVEENQAKALAQTLSEICKRKVEIVKIKTDGLGKRPFDAPEKIAKFGKEYEKLVKQVRPLKDAIDKILPKGISFEIYLGGSNKDGNGHDKSQQQESPAPPVTTEKKN